MEAVGLALGVIPLAIEVYRLLEEVREAYNDIQHGGFKKQSQAIYADCTRMLTSLQYMQSPDDTPQHIENQYIHIKE
jgi:hypothetical protein